MYVLVAGGGKVGANLARTLIRAGNEVTLVEQRSDRFDKLEAEFEHQVHKGDATELFTLERAGIARPPDIVVAVTGDDEVAFGGHRLALPTGSRLISVVRDGKAEIPEDTTQLEPGDSVLAILEPGKEDELRRVLVRG